MYSLCSSHTPVLSGFRQGIDEHGAGLLGVIDHSLFESGAPCSLIGPFGIAYEAAIGVSMQARTIRTIDTRNFRCAPPPCFAKLVFLAVMHSPPINRYEHLPLPMSFLFNALQKGLCRCRCARLCAIDHEEEDIAPNTVGRLPRNIV